MQYLEQDHQQTSADQQGDEAADEPAQPQDAVVQAHDPHGLLETRLLLVHHALDDDGHRVHPRQRHEERHGATDDTQEAGEEDMNG